MNNRNTIIIVVLIALICFIIYGGYSDNNSFKNASYLLNKKCINDCVNSECKLSSEIDYCNDEEVKLITMLCNEACKDK